MTEITLTPMLHPMPSRTYPIEPVKKEKEILPDTELTISDWQSLQQDHTDYLKNNDENAKDTEEIDTYIRITGHMIKALIRFWEQLQTGCACGYENTVDDIVWSNKDKEKILTQLSQCAEYARRDNFAEHIIRSLNHIYADLENETGKHIW